MKDYFSSLVKLVATLKPGEFTMADRRELEGPYEAAAIGSFIRLMTGFTQADRVLENVIGSSRTHRYWYERERQRYFGELFYARLHADLPEGVFSYTSPDRRHYYRHRADGLWQYPDTTLTSDDERRIACALEGHRWEPTKRQEIDPADLELPASPGEMPTDAVFHVRLVDAKRCRSCWLTV